MKKKQKKLLAKIVGRVVREELQRQLHDIARFTITMADVKPSDKPAEGVELGFKSMSGTSMEQSPVKLHRVAPELRVWELLGSLIDHESASNDEIAKMLQASGSIGFGTEDYDTWRDLGAAMDDHYNHHPETCNEEATNEEEVTQRYDGTTWHKVDQDGQPIASNNDDDDDGAGAAQTNLGPEDVD